MDDNEACDRLREAVEDVCAVSDDDTCKEMSDAAEKLCEPPTARDLHQRGQQYRGHNPEEVRTVLENEGRDAAKGVLVFIESGRFEPFLEATSDMFFKLDSDERELFTQRNPDAVQWMSVWNQMEDLNPYTEYVEQAESVLTPDRAERTDPPMAFKRRELREDSLLRDMAFRRRSYREWAPREFLDLGREKREIGSGMARELDIYTPEIRANLDFPADIDGDVIGRALFDRIEAGRFKPMVDEAINFFVVLDPDEKRLFGRRNPGLIEWINVWGWLNHMPHQNQGLFALSDVNWPFVAELDQQ